MNRFILFCTAATLGVQLSATTIFSEDFDPSGFSAYGGGNTELNPNTGGWYRMSLADTGFTVTDPGGALRLDASADFGANVDFASQTLATTGDSISVSFDATYNGTSTNSFAVRFGLFETGGIAANGGISTFPVDGIATQIGATTGTGSRFGLMNDNTGFNSAPDSFTGNWSASATSTTQTIGCTLTRNALDGLDVSFQLNGSTVAGSEVTVAAGDVPTYSVDTFAVFVVNPGVSSNEVLIDNVNVAVIPEPSSLALIGLVFAAAVVVRKRLA